ncbi:Predicted RNA binding protein YcfA, dsRBD-like fold, HicA-like mRNA interferase family [Polynucleobacter meluiroseus]|uniref:Predicted RNA binding protein YcfA, dsRBD-like fold, HicA-like mRNA interferase family n=2 Tax=Polynucleobacter meluiroseus TaxID=1938814 RepID=A0A240E0E1_9BURK|nr:Predicted RNA binding protein YcfA, dsRBD-like fold, HicA-like mRNA interferase family [Polynucleobacter meluiroseus]
MDNTSYYVYSVYIIYNLLMNSKELIKALEKDGWVLRGSKGSHHVFNHPAKSGHITVPHPKKDLGIGLVQKLLKQAGIK